MPPTLFTRDLKISPESWLHPRSSFLEKSRRIDRGVYKKIEDSCGLEPHMRRLAPSACLLLSYVCPHCSYHISLLTSFFFLLNFLGVLPCLRLWHSAHKLIRLSSSSPRSGCSFNSKIWCTSLALLSSLSLPFKILQSLTAILTLVSITA